jgi:radical SAM protein with 4Fe4S-binding SPASM domain
VNVRRSEVPTLVGWEITRRCNLSCPHCYTAASRGPSPELTTADCRRVVDSLAAMGTQAIGWTGGEPLLRDDLEAIAAYARDRGGIRSGVTTNGLLLDERRLLSLRDAGVSSIQISLDGSTPERNRRMRGATHEQFDRILDALRISRRAGVRLHLAMVLGAENLDDAPDFLRLARDEGVESVRFCGFVPAGRGRRRQVVERLGFGPDLGRLREFVGTALAAGPPHVLFDPAFGPLPPDWTFHDCVAGMETLYISSTGDVYPCTSLLHPRFVVGNLGERRLEDLWDDPKMTLVASLPRQDLASPCRECPCLPGCHGACRGIAFVRTGDLRASFPACLRC